MVRGSLRKLQLYMAGTLGAVNLTTSLIFTPVDWEYLWDRLAPVNWEYLHMSKPPDWFVHEAFKPNLSRDERKIFSF